MQMCDCVCMTVNASVHICMYECFQNSIYRMKIFNNVQKRSVQNRSLLLPPFFNQLVKLFTLLSLQCLFDLLVNVLHD